MDADNLADIVALAATADRVAMFRDFDPRVGERRSGRPDPYFGGDDGFERRARDRRAHRDALVRRELGPVVG